MKNTLFNEETAQLDLFSPQEEELLFHSSKIEITEEYINALNLLKSKVPLVFISGQAGTGKSVFIDHLRENSKGGIVIVAPTGVAALNVKGMTIHSFFRFPHKMITDDDLQSLNPSLIKAVKLIIIDEISMVRADILDAIDKSLRKNMENDEPFGGIQILLVGDMFQLPPVVLPNEWEMMRHQGYKNPYFFSAMVFKNCPIALQEFTKIYRQTDPEFITLLNKVRLAEDLDEAIPIINKRCVSEGNTPDPIITLACTNRVAININNSKLDSLPGSPLVYTGEIKGSIRVEQFKPPSPMHLYLKIGSQVMFTKNDIDKKWVNGTLGKIVKLDHNLETIQVEVKDDIGVQVFDVPKATWESHKYTFDSQAKQVVAEVVGSYHQYPLMLAWAVTIHKGQGKTLDRVKIDLGTEAFAHGQVYVALSRCRTLEGIYLLRPIKSDDIKCDPKVKRFYEKLRKQNNSSFEDKELYESNQD